MRKIERVAVKFNIALVLSFATTCLGKAFNPTVSSGYQRLVRREATLTTPGLADSGSNNGELIKKIVKVEDLKNEVLDREIKKWREAAKNVRQDSGVAPKV
ncbi:hypothetical protein DSO57_1006944 [Entomophthora muscae]|uniref:Uncharacterized protein n=1 Tax=Entomophthora muscae TaxID=34485 RepID=A0ACC2SX90_9FUNG|nr:hypothetical protein DSO57_1006944 [Entomophthora muscae]